MRHLLFILFLFPFLVHAQESRPKVGLVLGGGGAKGAAHVGVLKYIEESGVKIDMVVGTSIGSIVGGLYACGKSSDDLEELFRSQDWLDLLTKKSQEFQSDHTNGILRGDSVESLLGHLANQPENIDFDSLPIPFRCVAVNTNTAEEVVLSQGNLARSMRASMAIPLVFKQVNMNGMSLSDGGLLNNLPVDVAKAWGCDIIIAVDLTQNKHEDEDDEPSLLERISDKVKPKTLLVKLAKWAIERPDVDKYKENVANATIYINPDLDGYGAQSFTAKAISEMIQRGVNAGKEALPELKKLAESQLR